jgi:hypothetical protein
MLANISQTVEHEALTTDEEKMIEKVSAPRFFETSSEI